MRPRWRPLVKIKVKLKLEKVSKNAKLVKIEVKLELVKVSKNVQKKVPLCTANPP